MKRGEMERLVKDPKMRRRRQAINDPTRMRILSLVADSEGLTAKELGEKLRIEPNRLYYHLRILEGAGVIGVSQLRAAGRMSERVYKVAYDGRYIWDSQDPVELATHLSSQLEVTKIEGEELLFEQARAVKEGDEPPVISWGRPTVITTHKEIQEFMKRLNDLLTEFRDRAEALREKRTAPELKRMRLTWVICEQTAPGPAASALP